MRARLLTLLCLLLPLPGQASSLYRCIGEHGETVFSSSREGYNSCRRLSVPTAPNSGSAGSVPAPPASASPAAGSSAAGAAAPAAASSAAPAPTAPRVEFRTRSDGAEIRPPSAESGSGTRVTRGAVYRYVKDGVTHYTNRRPAGQRAEVLFSYMETCFACAPASRVDFNSVGLNTTAFVDEIRAAALAHGVEEALVRAVIHAESAFQIGALSNKGAQGLMQLMPATAERFGVSDPYSPQQNISGGTAYLAWLLRRFQGDVRLAVAGYNAGEGAVDRFGGIPPYAETQVFVERVGTLLNRYRTELASAGAAG
ncbi:MAG: lytic transglycosylase domain-containing protein [Aquimonas sp.]|nr:lytic transglycosylase domain-containing protein [Aquimonas sp.]